MEIKNKIYLNFSFLMFLFSTAYLEVSSIFKLVRDFISLVIFKNVYFTIFIIMLFFINTIFANKKYKILFLIINLSVLLIFSYRVYEFKSLYGYIVVPYSIFLKFLFFVGVVSFISTIFFTLKIFKDLK